MAKIKFPKKSVRINLPDLGYEEELYGEFWFEFWKDPSRAVVLDLVNLIVQSVDDLRNLKEEEQIETSDKFFDAVSRLITETNIDGLDFSTPGLAQESFSHPDLPWGFMYGVVTSYVLRLLETQQSLKKMLHESAETLNSGSDKKTKESSQRKVSPTPLTD